MCIDHNIPEGSSDELILETVSKIRFLELVNYINKGRDSYATEVTDEDILAIAEEITRFEKTNSQIIHGVIYDQSAGYSDPMDSIKGTEGFKLTNCEPITLEGAGNIKLVVSHLSLTTWQALWNKLFNNGLTPHYDKHIKSALKALNENELTKIFEDIFNKLEPGEQKKIEKADITITIVLGVDRFSQSSVWRVDGKSHDVHIFLKTLASLRGNSVVAWKIGNEKGKDVFTTGFDDTKLFEYYQAVIRHEMGHVLHAILHPAESRMSYNQDVPKEIENLLSPAFQGDHSEDATTEDATTEDATTEDATTEDATTEDATTEPKGEHSEGATGYADYAKNNVLESVAEIYTALQYEQDGGIDEKLLDWYHQQGGPKMAPKIYKKYD